MEAMLKRVQVEMGGRRGSSHGTNSKRETDIKDTKEREREREQSWSSTGREREKDRQATLKCSTLARCHYVKVKLRRATSTECHPKNSK